MRVTGSFAPYRQRLVVLLALAFFAAPVVLYRAATANVAPPGQPAPHHFPAKEAPAKGRFLVANEHMRDPSFSGTVILLIDYGWKGAVGVVVNRPTDVTLSAALPGVKGIGRTREKVWYGGPVGANRMVMLIRSAKALEGSTRLFADVYASSNRGLVEGFLDGSAKGEFRFYVGYAGWAPQQLEIEVLQGGWYVMDAAPEEVFSKDPSRVWQELIRRIKE
ncbi:MAG: YqgE/AlgH family protein [Thermodesulfobacteriota bacterium]